MRGCGSGSRCDVWCIDAVSGSDARTPAVATLTPESADFLAELGSFSYKKFPPFDEKLCEFAAFCGGCEKSLKNVICYYLMI
jgi:hypothetical protein